MEFILNVNVVLKKGRTYGHFLFIQLSNKIVYAILTFEDELYLNCLFKLVVSVAARVAPFYCDINANKRQKREGGTHEQGAVATRCLR